MATPVLDTSFATGELAPSLFGRIDYAKGRIAASTMRNLVVSYRGAAYSRGGTAIVGFSKQTGGQFPPELIPFQFNINQGRVLEFGNFYMRVITNGAFVTENPIAITGATRANPCVLSITAQGAVSATANTGSVTQSYVPFELITLSGGTFTAAAQLSIATTKLIGLQLATPGIGNYKNGDLLALTGGTQTGAAQLLVTFSTVVSATITAGGSGGANGPAIVTGTTGTGTKFQANVTISGNAITAINSIVTGGLYTTNPTTPAAEPVTGAGLSGATLNVVLGIGGFNISQVGAFTSNPPGGTFTQASTSGTGSGATFQFALMAPNTLTIATAGVYTSIPGNPVAQQSASVSGFGATFNLTWGAVPAFNNGDWIFLSQISGMTQLNNRTVIVNNSSPTSLSLLDVHGNSIDSTGYGTYTGGGSAARIFTLATPWAAVDLPYLKFTQSADVMSLCCVNQQTLTEYPPYDLARITDINWVLTQMLPGATVNPPTSPSASASASGSANYEYVVTSVSPVDGTESIASAIAGAFGAVNILSTSGTITVTWQPVANVNKYNVYKATPGINVTPPTGALFGYAGSSYGGQFLDLSIVPDFAQVPPLALNPFARGQITGLTLGAGGIGYTNAQVHINTSTGSGAVILAIVVGGQVVGFVIQNGGANYGPTDTVTIVGDGSGARALPTIGPQTGTYPSVPDYFQQRRVYANTLNNPDTYFMSQPGAFTNFDSRNPTIDTDAIIGTPWGVKVDGIQFMVNMPAGLVVMTGSSAWLLAGAGSFATNVQPITPSSQNDIAQAFSGCSATVAPIRINYDIIFLTSKNSLYYTLPYQLYALSEPIDLTQSSTHLFTGYTSIDSAWCEQPFRVMWAVRNDGVLLSFTYLKEQQIAGWARHDTQGQFQSVVSVTELPVDAAYFAVKRSLGSPLGRDYVIERMDNRLWTAAENVWAVDCGLTSVQPQPNANLSASSATGLGSVTGATGLVGGAKYSSATTATVVDNNGLGPGAGAVPTLTIVAGVITAVTFSGGNQGSGYVNPQLDISDPSGQGSGASATLVLNNTMTFTADSPVFSPGNVGSVIRMGGGVATITGFTNSEVVTANITSPIIAVVPGTSPAQVEPQAPGTWTMTAPFTVVNGLWHLVGQTVTGLADGNVIPPQVVAANGTITLGTPATFVTVGLGFTAQFQSVYLDAGQPTVQAQRKKVAAANVLVEASRGLKMGSNQIDASTLSPSPVAVPWTNMDVVPDLGIPAYNSPASPLYTGYARIPVQGGFQKPGQVALQQDNPLPMNILALVPEVLEGDTPAQTAPSRREMANA